MGCTTSTEVAAASSSSRGPTAAAATKPTGTATTTIKNGETRNNHDNNSNNKQQRQPLDDSKTTSTTTTTTGIATSAHATTTTKTGPACTEAPYVPSTAHSTHTDHLSTTTDTLTLSSSWRIRYACASRRGRDPEATEKPNQDAYSVHTHLATTTTDLFCGVYDGHGVDGQACSHFVRNRLPALVRDKLRAAVADDDFVVLSTNQIHHALHEAHLECNEALHAEESINDAASGTTAISLYLHPHHSQQPQQRHLNITVSNVGDSRAVLGTQQSSRFVALPLSKDQTPHRADEARRCQSYGARILTFGQISRGDNGGGDDESESEDPPRVWSRHGKHPGTAFTRSLGDTQAESLGVHAEPECMTLKIGANEKVIVLATDGIFDVMSNQQVMEMCMRYHALRDPLQACQQVIATSHQAWLRNEECESDNDPAASYDDMTLICIFLYENEEEEEKDIQSPAPKDETEKSHAIESEDTTKLTTTTTNDNDNLETEEDTPTAASLAASAANSWEDAPRPPIVATTTVPATATTATPDDQTQSQNQTAPTQQNPRRRVRQKTLRNLEEAMDLKKPADEPPQKEE